MPYKNEHAARQLSPDQFDQFRRGIPSGFPSGVSVIYGIKNGKTSIQSIRFDKDKWTIDEAKKWLKDHGFKSYIEPAATKIQKDFWNNIV